MKLYEILLEGADSHPTGVLVAFWLPPAVATQIALPGGEPPEELHITLCYLGKSDKLPRGSLRTLRGLLAEFATRYRPLVGALTGVGRFPATTASDGQDVIHAVPDFPGLVRLQSELATLLDSAGLPVSRKFVYHPHVTLAYVPSDDRGEYAILPTAFRLLELTLTVGEDRWSFPLGQVDEVLIGGQK